MFAERYFDGETEVQILQTQQLLERLAAQGSWKRLARELLVVQTSERYPRGSLRWKKAQADAEAVRRANLSALLDRGRCERCGREGFVRPVEDWVECEEGCREAS